MNSEDSSKYGFNYVLRDKLKEHCRKHDLSLHGSALDDKHDLMVQLVTYTSMGDWDQAVKCVEEINKFMKVRPPVMLVSSLNRGRYKRIRKRLMLEVWRNYFIHTKMALEHTGLHLRNFDLHKAPRSFAQRVKHFVGSSEELCSFIENKILEWNANSFQVYRRLLNRQKMEKIKSRNAKILKLNN